jgi:hypothetical protein
MGVVQDATGSYAIGYMLLSEFALICLIVDVLVLQRGAELLTTPREPGGANPGTVERAERSRQESRERGKRGEPA